MLKRVVRTFACVFAGASTGTACAVALAACSLGFEGAQFTRGSTADDAAGGAIDAASSGDAAADTSLPVDGAPLACTAPGDRCPDGTVLAATSKGQSLYTTPCDQGQALGSSECIGTRAREPFNDGNATGAVFVGATSSEDGQSNTTTLAVSDANASANGSQPHRAAKACADLVFGGASDWYLPAIDELTVLYVNRLVIGQFELEGNFYKSSTETHGASEPLNAARLRFMDGYVYPDGDSKPAAELFRCVRKH